MTALFIIVAVILGFLILNGTESILQELERVEDRQEALYTMVLGKTNSIKSEIGKIKEADLKAADGFEKHSDSEVECIKGLQEILTEMLAAIETLAEEAGSSLCDGPEYDNGDQEKENRRME